MNLSPTILSTEDQREIRASHLTESGRQVQDKPCRNRHAHNQRGEDYETEGQDIVDTEATLFSPDQFYSGDSQDSSYLIQLRLLTGWLYDMTFAEVSTVLGMDQAYLRDVLHEEAELTLNNYRQIKCVLDLTRQLRSILKPEIIGWWYRTSDPELSGKSPLELLEDNRTDGLEQLKQVVSSYFNMSYG